MNTQLAFAFGMLAMVAITMLVVIVVGMVKVIKLTKQIENLEQVIGREVEMIHRHSSDIERNIYSELSETRRNFDQYSENLKRDCMSYTDSRFDKFENKIMTKVEPDMTGLDLVIEKTKGKKQLLKD
jgi:biopolymer transport protein ExbB/TolQ